MSYKNYKWQAIARDFNSPFFRNYIWTCSPLVYPKLFDLPTPLIGIVSKENAIEYVADMKSWTATHEALKQKVLKDFTLVEKLIDDTNAFGESFNIWSEQEIFKADLVKKSSDELIVLLKQFFEKQSMLYSYGITLPILDFLGFSFVERKVEDFLKLKVSNDEYRYYFDIFTYPLHDSFAQDQESALLRLMSEFYSHEWKENILNKSNAELKQLYPDFYSKLEKHTEKFTWVYYVYAGPAFTIKHFLEFIKDYLSRNIDPHKKLAELEAKRRDSVKLREDAIKKLKPDAQDESFLRLAGKLVWAKPRRKDFQSRSYFHVEKLHRELAKRTFLSLSQIRSMSIDLIEQALNNNSGDTTIANSIFKLHVCIPESGKVHVLYGNDALDFTNNNLVQETAENYASTTELKGNTASPGKKTGKVKIVNRPEDMDKMEEGDILVSVATTPSIVPAMKKAAAIVTDEGGLTCHAAIVSRELGITCLIGTKIATKVFKDGDIVEVNTNDGIVKLV